MSFYIPPLPAWAVKSLETLERRFHWITILVTLVCLFGWFRAVYPPIPKGEGFWLWWNAIMLVVLSVFAFSAWRWLVHIRLLLRGRAFVFTNHLGQALVISPTREGRAWKAIQCDQSSFLNLAGHILRITGTGPTVSTAIFALFIQKYPELKELTQEEKEKFCSSIEEHLQNALIMLASSSKTSVSDA